VSSSTATPTRGSAYLHRHPRLRLAGVLGAPLLWLGVVYVGSLAALLVSSLWVQDTFTSEVFRTWTLANFRELLTEPLYRTVLLRTLLIAVLVTLVDLVLALPIAFFMAKVATPRTARLLVVACLMPLWASYLGKAYAWRLLVIDNGVLDSTFGASPGFGITATVLTLSYLWLPYMILPIYSGLERLPDSLLEASEDCGARPWRTFASVVWPSILPSVVAGSIFTFSLTLGDYITIKIVGGASQMLGSLVYDQQSLNLPLAAAIATFSVVVMGIYLLLVRRTGALDQL
jgi:putative spermidine/putrescine transport system permease protein